MPARRFKYLLISQATDDWFLEVPSAFTNNPSGRLPMTFGAIRLRYSINILATWGGMSNANSLRFFTSLAGNSRLEVAPGPSSINR